ncbi:MAG: uracil-DNA glycosylase [Akkermansiaceae bacterium]|nr:uracil-DNA glycosylase [Akkermansiaceae bacterium]
MIRPVDAIVEFLKAQEAEGVKSVYLDESARELLRQLHRQNAKPRKTPDAPAKAAPAPPRENPASRFAPSPSPVPAAARPTATPAPDLIVPDSGTAAEKIAALKAQAKGWPPAVALKSLRETMVFSCGNPEADLMLIGEAPGYEEEKLGEPFVGPAGQKLTEILRAMRLDRKDVYISNIVKFRPATPRQTTNNRKPTPAEMASCLPFIRAEVAIVRPKCIIALGGTACEGLLGLQGPVGSMRGSWHDFAGIPVRVTYHPAYLLHGQAALTDKRMIWEDMLAVMEKLGMPIDDKQRQFFLPK